MARSEKWVLEKARALLWKPRYTGFNPVAFTRAIEAEQDWSKHAKKHKTS